MSLPLPSFENGAPVKRISIIEDLMGMIERESPTLARSLRTFKHQSIGMFLTQVPLGKMDVYQDCNDLFRYVKGYVSRIFGPQTAQRTIDDLRRHPMILTANHHGVDYFAQSVQGSLLFSFLKAASYAQCTTVPIFACGNIPLNNLTYPRGALIYKVDSSIIDNLPLKLPLFSDKRKRSIISAVEPFDETMVKRSLKRLNGWRKQKVVNPIIANTLESILTDIYGASDILTNHSYSDQAVIINHRLWKRLFSSSMPASDLIYLELERIVGHLLALDLRHPSSLVAILIMDDWFRKKLIQALDGTAGCWNQKMLALRNSVGGTKERLTGVTQSCGSHFFWGVDDQGRRFPLCLVENPGSPARLVGVDDHGRKWVFDFEATAIIDKMATGRLVPSLFTSYLTVSFARGLTCIGGYYQSDYLPKMQQGVVDVLKQGGEPQIADQVASVSTNGYLSGMQAVTTEINNRFLTPAGPVEIIAGGGLSREEIDVIEEINVYDAHLASLCDTVIDIIPHLVREVRWKHELFSEIFQRLHHRTVCKRYLAINPS
jgi:hypothetical protein